MGLLELFIAATVPVLKVLIVTGVGSFLATNYVGVLGEDARKHLNNVVFYVFNPALVATNLAKTITFKSMISLWYMPVNILITFMIGSVLGWVIIQITKPPSQLRGLVLGCCAAGNMGNMLLIIIPAICKEKGSPFGAADACHTYGMAYVSLSMAIGAIFLWSYVYNIVRVSATNITIEDGVHGMNSTETSKLIPDGCKYGLISTKESLTADHYVALSSPSYARMNEKEAVSVKFNQFLKMLSGTIDLKKLFAPSTIGVIVGFIVGVIPQLRRALIGSSAPLRVIQDSAALLSDAAIPATTLIMGGNLLKGIHGSSMRASIIIGIVAVRYIALPLLGIAIIKGAVHVGLVNSNPLYQFVLLVQFAVPPAMNIGTITQLFGAGESECAVILLWCYVLSSVSLTLWSTFFMWLVS